MEARPANVLGSAFVLAALATTGMAQTPQWLEDLGDPERGEAAEIALVAGFEASKAALGELLNAWKTTAPRDLARLQGALRVVELAGTDAAELLPHLLAAAQPDRPYLPRELASAFISLLPGQMGNELEIRHAMFRLLRQDMEGTPLDLARGMARKSCRLDDAPAARAALAADVFGAREAACDALARFGDASDVAALRDRLLARDQPPAKPIRHNGFIVPVEDQFRLRAALAIARLAPTSPDAAIAYATLAELHPHRPIRLRSLRALAGQGPAVAQAIPELLVVANGLDEELAVAALQALLPAGAALAAEWSRLEQLARTERPRIAAAAHRLVAWLVDHHVERPQPSPAAAALARENAELRAAVAALTDYASPASVSAAAPLQAAGARSWPFLVDCYRRHLHRSPDQLLELLGSVGRMLPDDQLVEVRQALGTVGDMWVFSGMTSHRSGERAMRPAAITAYGRLVIGPPTLERQVEALQHDNPVVRVVAARELAAASAEVGAAVQADDAAGRSLFAALLQAADAEHPEKATFKWANGSSTRPMNLTAEIRAHAAAALVDCAVPAAKVLALFGRLDALADATIAARALGRWADGFDAERLALLANDRRPAVATTAKALLAARHSR